MSDHGFTTFDRAVNLNTWLWKNGYLTLEGGPGEDDVPFARVDWSKTQAYALGLNGLYLNLAGREKQGIVPPGVESQAILRKLGDDLVAFRDPNQLRVWPIGRTEFPAGEQSGPHGPEVTRSRCGPLEWRQPDGRRAASRRR